VLNNRSWYRSTSCPNAADSPARVSAISWASSLTADSLFWTQTHSQKFPPAFRQPEGLCAAPKGRSHHPIPGVDCQTLVTESLARDHDGPPPHNVSDYRALRIPPKEQLARGERRPGCRSDGGRRPPGSRGIIHPASDQTAAFRPGPWATRIATRRRRSPRRFRHLERLPRAAASPVLRPPRLP